MRETCDYDYVVVGAGPAGVQMAAFLQKAGRRYVVYEAKAMAGSFFARQPRNRRLLSINKKNNYWGEEEFNMRHDWNSLLSDDPELKFTPYTDDLYPNPDYLHQYINDFAEKLKLNIQYNTKVSKISKPGSTFKITTMRHNDTKERSVTTPCVLMATGALGENLPETIEGIELAESYDTYDINKERYKNKRVLIIGGGNSSFETAEHLAGTAGILHVSFNRQIQFAWHTHYVGDLRAVNNKVLDMYLLKSLHSTIASSVQKIKKNADGKLVVTFRDLGTHLDEPGWLYYEMEYDYVIGCMGWKYLKPEMFDDTIKISSVKNDRFAKLSNCWETETENLFYIGTTMAAIDRKSASGFIHGFRYNIRSLHNMLENRHFMKPLNHFELKSNCLQAIADKMLDRYTLSAGLYQMNTFLCDVVTIDETGTKYYTELPIGHVFERPEFKSAKHVFLVYFAYGFDRFGETYSSVEQVHAPEFTKNECAAFLHPIIEYHSYGKYVDQTELQESLVVRFNGEPKLAQWPTETDQNFIKFFVNGKVHWQKDPISLKIFSKEFMDMIMKPLTEEELSRVPKQWEPTTCKPNQELIPKDFMPERPRVLRPTEKEMMASAARNRAKSSEEMAM